MDRNVLTRSVRGGVGLPRLLFSLIGFGLLAAAFFFAQHAAEAQRDWIRVEGTIVDYTYGETNAPIVEYQGPDGETRTVTGKISSRPRAGKVGDRAPVLINPDNPEVVRLGTPLELWFAPGLLGGIGGVFVFVGTLAGGPAGAAQGHGRIGPKRLQQLRETGERVMARVTDILSIGANSAAKAAAHWRLKAEWRDPSTGALVFFISQPINIDPAPFVAVGDEIGVFVDRTDRKIYAFDFSLLPFDS